MIISIVLLFNLFSFTINVCINDIVDIRILIIVNKLMTQRCFFLIIISHCSIDNNRGYMNSSKLIQACNRAIQ